MLTLAEKPYLAIQGEGLNAGKPVIFVRTLGCNLACGFCDTKYTWHKDHIHEADVQKFAEQDFAEYLIKNFPTCSHVVFTGGEPTLQYKAILRVIFRLKEVGWTFEIETNGTIEVPSEFVQQFTPYTISPKLKNSNNEKKKRERWEVLKPLIEHANVVVKLVVKGREELEEVVGFVEKGGIKPQNVILMPEGVHSFQVLARSKEVMEMCLEHGFRFSTRLHVLAYEATRGV